MSINFNKAILKESKGLYNPLLLFFHPEKFPPNCTPPDLFCSSTLTNVLQRLPSHLALLLDTPYFLSHLLVLLSLRLPRSQDNAYLRPLLNLAQCLSSV